MRLVNLILLLLSYGCVEKIDLKVPVQDAKMVIEGKITGLNNYKRGSMLPKSDYVRLSKTTSTNQSFYNGYMSKAKITVEVSSNGVIDSIIQKGYYYYVPERNIPIQVGDVVTLKVVLNDSVYIAQDIMPGPCKIDSLFISYLEAGDAFAFSPAGQYLHVVFRDDPTRKNYYRYILYDNNDFPNTGKEQWLIDDKVLGTEQVTFVIPYLLYGGTIGFELQSISAKAYEYHRQLALNLTNDGGFFGTPPANPVSNISNGALGYFMAPNISRDTIVAP